MALLPLDWQVRHRYAKVPAGQIASQAVVQTPPACTIRSFMTTTYASTSSLRIPIDASKQACGAKELVLPKT